jgi:hypothetical protein
MASGIPSDHHLEKHMKKIAIPAVDIGLADGEQYAGLILSEDGTPIHHLVLLPGDHEDTEWQAAVDWAASIGGELPNRREQSLLFANCKQHFEEDWYWSGEQHASDARYAWFQYFGNGNQYYRHIYAQCRARAVRRLSI